MTNNVQKSEQEKLKPGTNKKVPQKNLTRIKNGKNKKNDDIKKILEKFNLVIHRVIKKIILQNRPHHLLKTVTLHQ